jgi:hypothetical protein
MAISSMARWARAKCRIRHIIDVMNNCFISYKLEAQNAARAYRNEIFVLLYMKIYAIQLRLTILIALAAISLVNFGCKKSKNESSDPLTLLTAKKWKRTKTDNNPGANPAGSGYDPVSDCVLDDRYEFKADGTHHTYFGAVKCDQNEPETISSTYSVDFETMEFLQVIYQTRILELTTERLKTATTTPLPGGVIIRMYSH